MGGYGESHPGSDGRDASAIGNENYMIARTTRNNSKGKEGQHNQIRTKLQALMHTSSIRSWRPV